jgi:hypothetical protein
MNIPTTLSWPSRSGGGGGGGGSSSSNMSSLQTRKKLGILLLPMYLGHAVVQLVAALCCKPEGHGFDSQWCKWNFSLI